MIAREPDAEAYMENVVLKLSERWFMTMKHYIYMIELIRNDRRIIKIKQHQYFSSVNITDQIDHLSHARILALVITVWPASS